MGESVLVAGGGGREHALLWKLAQSPHIGKLFVAPGNGGTRELAENIAIDADDIHGLAHFAEKNKIDLTVVGPDRPLALGIVDFFESRGLRIFGPTRRAAKIESSKAFSKELMLDTSVPTAGFRVFRKHSEALEHVRGRTLPLVIKPSGLTQGKGPRVCRTIFEAESALADMMSRRVYGNAGDQVVVEDFLLGPEVSFHVFCDGKSSLPFSPSGAQDHKMSHDGDEGKNTGGMGAVAPVPWFTKEMEGEIQRKITNPILDGLEKRGMPFKGLLFPGLIKTEDGFKVLEFNGRFGDPEAQALIRLLKSDLFGVLKACIDGTLYKIKALESYPGFAVSVALASHGYPGEYKKGIPIRGIEEASRIPGVVIFHAGTRYVYGGFETSGGRVLHVSAVGDTLQDALNLAYEAVSLIHFEGMHYRRDIGAKALRDLA